MLQRADCVVVSYGKSGRTWLRVMISRFYQLRYGMPQDALLSFDNLHKRNGAIPKILFTHDNYIADITGNRADKADFRGKKVILLTRHPGDVAVSQYFQWRFRMAARKKALNGYPAHGADVSVQDFVLRHEAGLDRAVAFLNEWAGAMPGLSNVLVVRYEDLRADTAAALRRVLEYIGGNPTKEEVAEAVSFASVENMRQLETRSVFRQSGSRLLATNKDNPDSYKVRRAKVGGYRDYFDDSEAEQIDCYIAKHLAPVFGYSPVAPGADSQKAAMHG